MTLPEFARSTTFRSTAAVTVLFGVFTAALFGFVYWKTDRYLTTRTDGLIAAQMKALSALSPERLLAAIEERPLQDPRRVQFAGLFGSDGHRIAGNMETLPPYFSIDGS